MALDGCSDGRTGVRGPYAGAGTEQQSWSDGRVWGGYIDYGLGSVDGASRCMDPDFEIKVGPRHGSCHRLEALKWTRQCPTSVPKATHIGCCLHPPPHLHCVSLLETVSGLGLCLVLAQSRLNVLGGEGGTLLARYPASWPLGESCHSVF